MKQELCGIKKTFPKKKKKNSVMGLMKHDLCGKTMTKFAGLKSKIYRYLTNNSDENEKAKGTKMFFIKQKF